MLLRTCGEKHADRKFGCVEQLGSEGADMSVPLLADLVRVDLLGNSLELIF